MIYIPHHILFTYPEMHESGWLSIQMDEGGWKLINIDKWINMAKIWWKWIKWMEMDKSGWKWIEKDEMDKNGWKDDENAIL